MSGSCMDCGTAVRSYSALKISKMCDVYFFKIFISRPGSDHWSMRSPTLTKHVFVENGVSWTRGEAAPPLCRAPSLSFLVSMR